MSSCRAVLKSVLTQLWCNPECVQQRRFSRRRAHVVIKRWPGRPPRARHTRPMISLDRLACRAYGALALKRRSVKIHRSQPACRQHQRPRCSLRIIGMLWTGRSCRRRQCWLWRKRKRAAGPASAPKLRQNRFKYRATAVWPDRTKRKMKHAKSFPRIIRLKKAFQNRP